MDELVDRASLVLTGIGTGGLLRVVDTLAQSMSHGADVSRIRERVRRLDHKRSIRVLPLHNTAIRAAWILVAVSGACSTQEAWCLADDLGSDIENLLPWPVGPVDEPQALLSNLRDAAIEQWMNWVEDHIQFDLRPGESYEARERRLRLASDANASVVE